MKAFVAAIIGLLVLIPLISVGAAFPGQVNTSLDLKMTPVESGSMSPNINIGDILYYQVASEVIPWDVAEKEGYATFNNPGDVIIYRPYGKEILNQTDQAKAILGLPYPPDKATPIIHRALRFVDKGQPMWDGGPKAPFSGYITKGDHNDRIDQMAGAILGLANATYIQEHRDQMIEVDPGSMYIDKKTGLIIYEAGNKTYVGEGISYLTPVKKEWILGVARIRLPNAQEMSEIIKNMGGNTNKSQFLDALLN